MDKSIRRFYQFDSFLVDVAERQLRQNGKRVLLTPKVFDILLVLVENKGLTVEKEELIEKVWADTFVEEGSLNRNISTLRKALGDDSNEQKFIKTLPKRGYRFTANVEEIFEDAAQAAEKPAEIDPSPDKIAGLSVKAFFRENRPKIIFAILVVSVLSAALAWTLNRARRPNIDLSGLTENERRQLATRGSKNIQAYENYVNGRRLWHQRSAEGLYQSIVLLERAVKADPEFALARAALADAYAFDTEKRFSAAAEARETIRLDPTLGQSYAALGFVQMFWEWKLPDARESFAKAVELSPDYATAHQWYALNLIAGNNGGAALAEMKRAFELEPNSLAINADLCQIQYFLRKYDDAIAQCRRTLEMDAGFINAHFYLYEIYTAKEMHAEAVAEFFKIEELKSDFTLPFADLEKLRKAFERGGIRAFWLARIEILQSGPHFYGLARYHARLGEKEKALAFLFKASAAREFDFVFVVADPVFRDLISDRQLAELTQALELSKKSN